MNPVQRTEPAKGFPSLVLLALTGLIWAACLHNPAVWRVTGIGETPVPYLDLYGSLAAGERAATGGNPYELNPLDPFNRPHLYSSWWLIPGRWGLVRNDVRWLGPVLTGLGLLMAVSLIRPRTLAQAGEAALLLASPAVLMAVNRGNNDWVIFLLLGSALLLFKAKTPALRLAAAAMLALAAALKYYPLASLVMLLAARTRRELLRLGLVSAGVLTLSLPASVDGLLAAWRYTPGPEGLYAFGAPILFRSFGLPPLAGLLLAATTILIGTCWMLRSATPATGDAQPDSQGESEMFATAAALTVASFFLGASYLYKLLFIVLLLPSFWRNRALPDEPGFVRALRWVLPVLLWLEGAMAILINTGISRFAPSLALPAVHATIIAAQLTTWWVMSALGAMLFRYASGHLKRLRARPASPVSGEPPR